ncbi:AfsR/SARP family transcriptional regulator [Jiangella endophytica]|uniref:AfsR/SARP family transcriptional regulator n=1 Tax=Jiangella endophytica TaxID=1623398 RepID=UPI0018E539FD|nr:BTAD domain-containing putative transcriptional regulator [Jiangella endophytica]
MRFEVLGPLRVRCESDPVVVSGSLRQGVLALLLAHAGHPVSADALVDALWGGAAGAGGSKLQLHVHKLRRLLDTPDRLSHDAGAYRLRVGAGELDAERFASMVAEAETVAGADPDRAAGLLGDALALWRGDPYQGLDLPALAGEVQRLTELRLVARERLAAAELARGRTTAAIAQLTDLVRVHPLRERAHALLMTALWAGGRQADALAVYRDVRQALVDELGLEPGTELRDLERRILSGEPCPAPSSARPQAPAPAELPPGAGVFVGRDAELDELSRIADRPDGAARIVAVTGTGGVGKTTLAVRWGRLAVERFPDGQLYVDLRGFGPGPPVAVDEALARLLRAMGVDGPAIAADPDERAAQFRTLVDGKRLLLVLDNALAAEHVRPILPGSTSCFVVVTSRDALSGLAARDDAQRIDLNRLTGADASRLMDELLGEPLGGDVERIVQRCAGLPLALRIAAERIRERRGGDLTDLAAGLADEQDRLDLLEVGDDPQASVRSVFSWSYRALAPDVARTFRLCGLHPGSDFDVFAVCALTGERDRRAARRRLDALVRARLVDETGGRYQMHDLLRTYAAELAPVEDGESACAEASARLGRWYLHAAAGAVAAVAPGTAAEPAVPAPDVPAGPFGPDAAVRWLDAELDTLLVIAAGDPAAYAAELSAILWSHLDQRLYLEEARRLHGRALTAARDAGDEIAEGWALTGLGLTCLRLGDPDAEALLTAAIVLHERHGRRKSLATTLNYLAAVTHVQGRAEAAIAHLRRAIALYDELGEESLASRPLNNLGRFYLVARRYDEAKACMERSLAISERTGERVSRAHILLDLGALARATGRYEQALEHGLNALAAARENGVTRLEGAALSDVGVAYGELGDRVRAFDHHEAALRVADQPRARVLRPLVLVGLGRTRRAFGETDDAVRAYAEVVAVAGDADTALRAIALQELGELSAERGDRSGAREHWRRAVEVFDVLARPEAADLRSRLAELDDGSPGENALEEQTGS